MRSSRYREYADFYGCSLQEAQRVLHLEDRIEALRTIHRQLGEVYTPQKVADGLRDLIDLLLADAQEEHSR